MHAPHPRRRRTSKAAPLLGCLALAALLGACDDASRSAAPDGPTANAPRYTQGSGSVSTLLGRATIADPFKVKRETNGWEVEVEASNPMDVAVQSISFPAGSHSGWHGHPGPVFIQVTSGTMTFYESEDPTCTPIVRSAGQGYLDTGDHAHIARNESGAPATNVVTYFAPPGAALRIDAPNPGNCPF